MESNTVHKIVAIDTLCSANSPYFMYARGTEIDKFDKKKMTADGRPCSVDFLISGHSDIVMFFQGHYERNYKDMTFKLCAIKFFGKKPYEVVAPTVHAEVNKIKLFAGTCLALATEFDLNRNGTDSAYKVDIWLDGQTETISFHLKDPGDYDVTLVLGSHNTDLSVITQ